MHEFLTKERFCIIQIFQEQFGLVPLSSKSVIWKNKVTSQNQSLHNL